MTSSISHKWFFLISFICLIGIFAIYLFLKRENSQIEYQELIMQSKPLNEANRTSRQHRKGIQKEILFSGTHERLRGRLKGIRSELVLLHQEESTELVEELSDVVCTVQEDLYFLLPDGREARRQPNGRLLIKNMDPQNEESWVEENNLKPMQLVKYLEAEQAKYYYKTDLFVGETVYIARYLLEGHKLPDVLNKNNPLMTGKAQIAELSLIGKDPTFKATQLQITMPFKGKNL